MEMMREEMGAMEEEMGRMRGELEGVEDKEFTLKSYKKRVS